LVYPAEIVGKRTRVKLDGSKQIKVHLDKNQQTTVEHKVRLFKELINLIFLFLSFRSKHLHQFIKN
jgi:hypothetical protein